MPVTGCSNKAAEARRQAAYEQGLQTGKNSIKRENSGEDEGELTKEEHDALASAVKKQKEESKQKVAKAPSVAKDYEGADGPTYVIDTLNNRVHKHNSGCSLLGSESGRATVEAWDGTLEQANAAGYTSCPECILKIGGGRS